MTCHEGRIDVKNKLTLIAGALSSILLIVLCVISYQIAKKEITKLTLDQQLSSLEDVKQNIFQYNVSNMKSLGALKALVTRLSAKDQDSDASVTVKDTDEKGRVFYIDVDLN